MNAGDDLWFSTKINKAAKRPAPQPMRTLQRSTRDHAMMIHRSEDMRRSTPVHSRSSSVTPPMVTCTSSYITSGSTLTFEPRKEFR